MAMALSSSAVACAECMLTPRARYTGTRMNAAPSPATVSTIVKASVTSAAMR